VFSEVHLRELATWPMRYGQLAYGRASLATTILGSTDEEVKTRREAGTHSLPTSLYQRRQPGYRMEEDVVKLTMDFRQVGIATTLSSLMALMVALMAASGVLALRHPEQALVARSC
jgi:hypothetical protein